MTIIQIIGAACIIGGAMIGELAKSKDTIFLDEDGMIEQTFDKDEK